MELELLFKKAGQAAAATLTAKTAAGEFYNELARCNQSHTEIQIGKLAHLLIAAAVVWPEEWPAPATSFFGLRLQGDNLGAVLATASRGWSGLWPRSVVGFLIAFFGEKRLEQCLPDGVIVSPVGVDESDGWVIGGGAKVVEARNRWKRGL